MEITILTQAETIKTTIINQPLIDAFSQSQNKEDFIKSMLHNGLLISKCINPLPDTCKCCLKIDDLTSMMEPFNTGGNSVKNGQFGEIFASETFTKRNPHILYEDSSKVEKSGDAILTIQNHSVDKVMIDYKNYDSSIPSDEVSKLVRDLHSQNINFGILISYKSKISKRKYIDYSIIDGKLIVFVAAYGLDTFTIEMAIQYVQRLHECNTLSISQKVSELVTKGTMQKISDIYEKIYGLGLQLSQNINSMKENQEKIHKMFNQMIMNNDKILTSINLLKEETDEYMKDIHREPILNKHSYTDLYTIVNRVIDKPKDKLYATRILNITQELGIDGFHSEKDNCIHFQDIGKLQITKSKLDMIFYNRFDEDCSFNRKYERIKNDDFYITLSDESKKWEIIQTRFTN